MPWLDNGAVWWLEGRPSENGRVVLVRAEPDEDPVDVVPQAFNVRTGVHEYGGGAYCIHAGTAFFSNFDDQRLYRVDPGGAPVAITPAVEGKSHRYADGRITSDGVLWIGVRERHSPSGRSADVVNELVALPTDGSSEPRVIASGRDFYSNPRISPDGSRLCFLAWNLPWMPWDGCELHVGDLAAAGELSGVAHVAGGDGEESIWQPEWSPSGDLVFASDRSGWWNLERFRESRTLGSLRRGGGVRLPGVDLRYELVRVRRAMAASCVRTTPTGSRPLVCSIPTRGGWRSSTWYWIRGGARHTCGPTMTAWSSLPAPPRFPTRSC